jgi:tetratricopeptide (TPR) repeat protein
MNSKRYLKAADGFEQSFLRVLQPDLNFGRNVAYVQIPALLFSLRALGLAQSGKYEEALREAKRCETSMPGHLPLTERLVPLLDARGRKKDADELYQQTRKTYERIIKDYPKSALMHNQVGWLSATCKRDLEKGLASARRAVELAPKTAAYHDTLAEVLFQMGKKDDAIAAQKKAVQLDPKREYFKKQLKRIESGDPKAARPTEEE